MNASKFKKSNKKSVKSSLSKWSKKRNKKMSIGKQIYYFTRITDYGIVASISSSQQAGSLTFTLADLPNYAEFQNLYDQYKISAVRVTFYPVAQAYQNQGSSTTPVTILPRFITAFDYDDDSVSGLNFDTLRQYQSAKITMADKIHVRYIKPCQAVEIYKSTTTSGYGPRRGFCDTTHALTPHYGIKYCMEQTNGTSSPEGAYKYKIEAKYYLALRSVK